MLYQHFHMTKCKENLLSRLLSHVLILFLAVVALPVAQPTRDDDEDEDMVDAGCIMAEGEKNSSDLGIGFSQAIATAITFSFVYKAHSNCKGTMFPTIQISRNGFEIFLYDSHTDILLMNSFTWAPKNMGLLWAVLHYSLLMTETTLSEDFKCNYKKLSDEYGGFTRLEGRAKFAVPITRVSYYQINSSNVLVRCVCKGKLFP